MQIQGGSRLVRNGITASGRHTRPRQNEGLPVEMTERSQPTSAASSTGVSKSNGSTRIDPQKHASSTSSKKKGSNSQSKTGTVASKVQHAMVKPAAEYADISIFPRRKAGQSGIGSNRPPVVITREVLEEHFNMPLLSVCKKLVIFPVVCMLQILVMHVKDQRLHVRNLFLLTSSCDSVRVQGLCATVLKKVWAIGGIQVAV